MICEWKDESHARSDVVDDDGDSQAVVAPQEVLEERGLAAALVIISTCFVGFFDEHDRPESPRAGSQAMLFPYRLGSFLS